MRKRSNDTVLDYSQHTMSKILLMCGCLGMAGLILIILSNEYPGDIADIGFAFGYVMMLFSLFHPARKLTKKRMICLALAALECRTIICEDDVVFFMRIDRPTARHIIMGDYDYLMNDPLFCRYMPY